MMKMENFDTIEKYLLGQMSETEVRDIEARMASDSEFKTEVEHLKTMILGVESFGLKKKLKGRSIGESVDNQTEDEIKVVEMKSTRTISFQKLAIAASFTAILFAGWWFLKPGDTGTNELFSDAFVTDPGLPTRMSESDNYDFYDAMVEYKMENYEKALEIWAESEGTIGADTLNYYMGMAQLNLNNYSEAEKNLATIDAESPFSEKAKWYQLKMLIDDKKYEEAKKLIETISPDVSSSYQEIKTFLQNQ